MPEEKALSDARARISEYRNRIQHLNNNEIDLLFREARNHNWWQDKEVSDGQLREIWEIMKFGSTSSNTQPARIIFIRSQEAKEKLAPCLMPANLEKTMAAPVTALLAYDLEFHKDFARNYPVRPELGERFRNDESVAEKFAFQQCTLQGAYLIMAIRAVGLDAGAMGGFNTELADEVFFAGKNWKSNFLCNIGYGDLEGIKGPRLYRYDFDEVCEVI
ncbi:MAG: putative malonic semialdehyde reductase RutE [Alphaproteobacteria bacterium MarineAlpha11_Bin1]|nr:MAG: putative malonic semialdehyde reductase RutE [Alphaproteobacteria bacterium MarineAlpha11_Bin1]|tara:strand:- start:27875 stop:28528 length:654 start_codon:yes stop_codon:yes gene_type:complete